MPRELLANAIDVHRATADEVFEQAEALSGTVAVRAEVHRFARLADDGCVAGGAALRHPKNAFFTGALAHYGPDDLRDHVAGALHDHRVAFADVFAADVVFVVQRRQLDCRARDLHGIEDSEGVERAGAADVDVDAQELRGRLGWRELVGDRPARLASDDAELTLRAKRIDLHDDAVDFVVERVALLDPLLAECDHVIEPLEALDLVVDSEAARL